MSSAPWLIRAMEPVDLPQVARIQELAPEASHWNPADYLAYEAFVAVAADVVAGFAVVRLLPPDELEILNVATDPRFRRRGVGTALLAELLKLPGKVLFLEVRESNTAARGLYARAGFTENGRRKNYYPGLKIPTESREDAVVMKMQKW